MCWIGTPEKSATPYNMFYILKQYLINLIFHWSTVLLMLLWSHLCLYLWNDDIFMFCFYSFFVFILFCCNKWQMSKECCVIITVEFCFIWIYIYLLTYLCVCYVGGIVTGRTCDGNLFRKLTNWPEWLFKFIFP